MVMKSKAVKVKSRYEYRQPDWAYIESGMRSVRYERKSVLPEGNAIVSAANKRCAVNGQD